MEKLQAGVGDKVYSRVEIYNDGTVPDAGENELLAGVGSRGVLINIGHAEMDPTKLIYLVSFEKDDGGSGPLVACAVEELSSKPL